MPLGGRKNKGKKPAPMLMVDSGSFNAEQSFAVEAASLTLGQGTQSKTGGKEITFTEHGISYDNDMRKLSEESFECWVAGKTTFLGRGAAGMVELMREKGTGDPVAVKHMSMTSKSDRDQTIEEVRSMWKLEHPNVVRFHGAYFCAKDQTVCFVLEYMNSNSLQHILKKCQGTPMPEPVVGRLVGDILEGVRYLHSQKIIHRDLKPGSASPLSACLSRLPLLLRSRLSHCCSCLRRRAVSRRRQGRDSQGGRFWDRENHGEH